MGCHFVVASVATVIQSVLVSNYSMGTEMEGLLVSSKPCLACQASLGRTGRASQFGSPTGARQDLACTDYEVSRLMNQTQVYH